MISWLLFLGLATVWGASFAVIKVGLESVPPLTLAASRLIVAALTLLPFAAVLLRRGAWGLSSARPILAFAVLALACPFSLMAWGQQWIPSGLAGVLVASSPLFGLVLATRLLPDERLTPARLAGLALGLLGVLVMVDPFSDHTGAQAQGIVALLGSSFSYAAGMVLARRWLTAVTPTGLAVGSIFVAAVPVAILAIVFEGPTQSSVIQPSGAISILWLGALSTALAYIVSARLLAVWGAVRTSLTSYVVPLASLGFGVALHSEPLTVGLVTGACLLVAGVALVNFAGRSKLQRSV